MSQSRYAEAGFRHGYTSLSLSLAFSASLSLGQCLFLLSAWTACLVDLGYCSNAWQSLACRAGRTHLCLLCASGCSCFAFLCSAIKLSQTSCPVVLRGITCAQRRDCKQNVEDPGAATESYEPQLKEDG